MTMIRLAAFAVTTALMLSFTASPAAAKRHHGYHSYKHHSHSYRHAPRARYVRMASRGGDPRPGAWCAWYVRQIKGISVKYGNLAHGLMAWGHPSGPVPGAVAVMNRRHAGIVNGSCTLRGGVTGVSMTSGNTWGRGVRNGIGTACYPVAAFKGFRV